MQLTQIWQRLSYTRNKKTKKAKMKNLKTIGKAGIAAIVMVLFLGTNVRADDALDKEVKNVSAKELLVMKKLVAELQKDSDLALLERELIKEGVLECGDITNVKVLDISGAILYEGSISGFTFTDKILKKNVERADYLASVDNTDYYMIF